MINGKKILSVITARAGSQGLPGKNYKELMGIPLFIWSVKASVASKYVDKTLISSNCKECEEAYLYYFRKNDEFKDVAWLQRPEEISTSSSKNEEALIHAINWERDASGREYDTVINLQPTSPCRYPTLIDDCIESYHNGSYLSLFTAGKYTPFFWQKRDGKWKYITGNDCCDRKMRQQFIDDNENSEFLMHDNGSIYIVDIDVLLKTRCRISNNHNIFETKGMYNLQIDEEHDFKMIECMLNSMEKKSPID
jgi:CMP-N-acetylneuraminic acid synthetase